VDAHKLTRGQQMATWTPDLAWRPKRPQEKLAYVASFDPTRKRPDAMAVVDLDPESAGYGRIVEQTDLVCSTKGTLPNPIFAAKHGR